MRRYALEDPGTYLIYAKHGIDIDQYPAVRAHLRQYKEQLEGRATDQAWYELQQPQEAYEERFKQPKIVQPDLAEEVRFHLDSDGVFTTNTAYFIPDEDCFILALLNSQLINFFLASTSAEYRGGYMRLFGQYVENIPIRDVDFTTPEDEREQHVEALIRDYEAARRSDAPPGDTAVLDAVEDHLSADPEQADVVHDLLAHLAREMTRLKEERHTYHLDVTDYVATPSDDAGVGLREIGRYQPVPGAPNSLLAATTEQRDGLRIGRLTATHRGDAVTVCATARFKPHGERSEWPDVVPTDAEPDQWGYVETEPIDVCTLHDCSELEAGLVVHWLAALNDAESGFSGYRDTATKTISLLDRLYDLRLPDPSDEDVRDALRPFLDNAAAAADLDVQIEFTDGLIDRVVYRLYGLSDTEVAVVEEN